MKTGMKQVIKGVKLPLHIKRFKSYHFVEMTVMS